MPASVLKTVLRSARAVTLRGRDDRGGASRLAVDRRPKHPLPRLPSSSSAASWSHPLSRKRPDRRPSSPRRHRMAMLEVLAPQAAISLDAARLYADLMDENLRRIQAEFELREARSDLARANQITGHGEPGVVDRHDDQPAAREPRRPGRCRPALAQQKRTGPRGSGQQPREHPGSGTARRRHHRGAALAGEAAAVDARAGLCGRYPR